MREHARLKRYYSNESIYFITTKTSTELPIFNDHNCSKILLENIKLAKQLLKFKLFAFIIMPDHVHLLMQPTGTKNISQIMHFIKRNTSRELNDLSDVNLITENISLNLPCQKELSEHKKEISKINVKVNETFKWQKSFYDRVIRKKEFDKAITYINKKNLNDLLEKYDYPNDNLANYPFYSNTNTNIINLK